MKNLKPAKAKKQLFCIVDSILEEKNFLTDPVRNFTRHRKISFRETMIFPMIADCGSLDIEILDYFSPDRLPTAAALSYRRDQIKPEAFESVFHRFANSLPSRKKFKGMRLIACDGTRLNTPYNPKDPFSYADSIEGRKGFNQVHLTTCYDLQNDCYLDAVIQGYHEMNEREAFCLMLDRHTDREDTVFIADRGFFSYNVIAHAFDNSSSFLIRLDAVNAGSMFHNVPDILSSERVDYDDDITVGRRRTKETKALRNYHYIPKNKTYDMISFGENRVDTFHLRLLKFPLAGGEYEYIATNLPRRRFPAEVIEEMYRKRWGVETSFRYLKYAQGLVHMHSLKHNFILQEIFAKLTAYNFCAAVNQGMEDSSPAETTYQYVRNISYLIKVCIRFLKGILKGVEELAKKKKVPVRPNRSYKRTMKRQAADTLQYR